MSDDKWLENLVAEMTEETGPLTVDAEKFKRVVRALPKNDPKRKEIAKTKLEIRKLNKIIRENQKILGKLFITT